LKEELEVSARDLSLNKEKCRQLQLKVDEASKSTKILNEQVFYLQLLKFNKINIINKNNFYFLFKIKKIQAQKDQRDKLFKNERSKLEKEIEKLKARIQTLTAAKTKDLQSIFFCN
jgi:hypothetical protein